MYACMPKIAYGLINKIINPAIKLLKYYHHFVWLAAKFIAPFINDSDCRGITIDQQHDIKHFIERLLHVTR